eukprot:11381547-Alexandrium_andersonii.AAC.1
MAVATLLSQVTGTKASGALAVAPEHTQSYDVQFAMLVLAVSLLALNLVCAIIYLFRRPQVIYMPPHPTYAPPKPVNPEETPDPPK